MKFIIEPRQVRITIQIAKKGLKYVVIASHFTEEGYLDFKDYYTTYFKYNVRKFIVDLLDEAVFDGIRSTDIEVFNFTRIRIKLGNIKVIEIG